MARFHVTFKFQHSSFKLNFMDEWLNFSSESAVVTERAQGVMQARHTRQLHDRSMAERVRWIPMP